MHSKLVFLLKISIVSTIKIEGKEDTQEGLNNLKILEATFTGTNCYSKLNDNVRKGKDLEVEHFFGEIQETGHKVFYEKNGNENITSSAKNVEIEGKNEHLTKFLDINGKLDHESKNINPHGNDSINNYESRNKNTLTESNQEKTKNSRIGASMRIRLSYYKRLIPDINIPRNLLN